jgi:hypothetical protein
MRALFKTHVNVSRQKMRAIFNSYKTLPLALLFDGRLATTALRDALNLWLPLAPMGELLPADLKGPSIRIQNGNKVIIYLREVGDAFAAIESPNHPSTGVEPRYFDDISQTIWELEDNPSASQPQKGPEFQVCYLVDLSLLRRCYRNGSTRMLRAAKLLICRHELSTLHCQDDNFVTFKVFRTDANHDPRTMIKIGNEMSIKMDLSKSLTNQKRGSYL